MDQKTKKLLEMRKKASEGGGPEKIKRHHAKGRYTARECSGQIIPRLWILKNSICLKPIVATISEWKRKST